MRKNIFVSLLILAFFNYLPPLYAENIKNSSSSFTPWHFSIGKGELYFESSAKSEITKKWFIEGLKLLHSFEYQQATYAFRKVQELEPQYKMGYWGEIMSGLHLLWYSGDYERVFAVYQKMESKSDWKQLNPIEESLVNSLSFLISSDNTLNVKGYNHYMYQQYERYPDNSEINAFYALSILATRHGIYDLERSRDADKVLKKIYKTYSNHPGILHYIIHSNENSINYFAALNAAERLGEVAPYALHSVHMPSHIYSAAGMWSKSEQINKLAWQRSLLRQEELNLNDDSLEYHSMLFLVDALLNLRKFDEAFDYIKQIMSKQESLVRNDHFADLLANYIVQAPAIDKNKTKFINEYESLNNISFNKKAAKLFTLAFYNYKLDKDKFLKFYEKFNSEILPNKNKLHQSQQDEISMMALMLKAMHDITNNDFAEAVQNLKQAVTFEQTAFYEKNIVKPPAEFLADVLLQYKRPDQAQAYYQQALILTKNRRLSLEGLLESAKLNEDSQFVEFAKNARHIE